MMRRKAFILAALAAAVPVRVEAAATLAVTSVDRSQPGLVHAALPDRRPGSAARPRHAATRPGRHEAPWAADENDRGRHHLVADRSRDVEPELRADGIRTADAPRPRRRHRDGRQTRLLTPRRG